MTRQADDAELFVRTWQDSRSVAEVAERMDVSIANATNRASRYRKKGISLRYFYGNSGRGRPRLDATRLAAIARGEE